MSGGGYLGRVWSRAAADKGRGEMNLVRHKRISEWMAQVCAVFEDGQYWFAEGYEREQRLLSEIAVLRKAKVIPHESSREVVSLRDIKAIREGAHVVDEDVDEQTRQARRKWEEALEVAAQARASDLVLEIDEAVCRVSAIVNDRKYQIGDLWTTGEGRRAMSKVFFVKERGSQQTSYQEREFQGFALRDRTRVRMPNRVGSLRGERGPSAPAGEHMFLRLLYADSLQELSLEKLGFATDQLEVFHRQCRTLRGATIVGGVTGDGKSTTLAACMDYQQRVFEGALNVVTVEDPVEIHIPSAVQLSVSTAAKGQARDDAFGEALRHFCRINPAVGMVSEIRDKEAARQVMRFVDTGHQVWTTLHAGDANGIVFRLLDLGVPMEQVCNVGNLALLVKQTIVSVLCEACRVRARDSIPDWVAADLGTDEVWVRSPDGCEACRKGSGVSAQAWSGYRGRRAVAEMIQPDAKYLEYVRRREPNQALRYWLEEMGGVSVHQRVRDLVLEGDVDPLDALAKGLVLGEGGVVRAGLPGRLSVVGAHGGDD